VRNLVREGKLDWVLSTESGIGGSGYTSNWLGSRQDRGPNLSGAFEVSQVEVVDPAAKPHVERAIFDPLRWKQYKKEEEQFADFVQPGDLENLRTRTRFLYWFDVELKASNIIIESIQIRTSDPAVPYVFILSESDPGNWEEWEHRSMLPVSKVTQETFTVPLGANGVPYVNSLKQNRLFCGLVIFFNERPYRFDIHTGTAMRDYYRRPITYKTTVRYMVNRSTASTA
jgi:hypothetical protein